MFKLSEFGKELRKLRVDRELTLVDLGKQLEVSAAFLSALETGRKAVPSDFVSKIAAALNPGATYLDQLSRAAAKDLRSLTINLDGHSTSAREVAYAFARKLQELDTNPEALERFKRLMDEED